jgi:hypothetical protein
MIIGSTPMSYDRMTYLLAIVLVCSYGMVMWL